MRRARIIDQDRHESCAVGRAKRQGKASMAEAVRDAKRRAAPPPHPRQANRLLLALSILIAAVWLACLAGVAFFLVGFRSLG
jgi:hypothetical protein